MRAKRTTAAVTEDAPPQAGSGTVANIELFSGSEDALGSPERPEGSIGKKLLFDSKGGSSVLAIQN